jgi:hypothetical protein
LLPWGSRARVVLLCSSMAHHVCVHCSVDVLQQARLAVMEAWTALPAEEKGPYNKAFQLLLDVREQSCVAS